jgi:crotonobetainyl-CoA:carnitine CoA-transferase CaiB-like acyl-CoA transferase
MPKRTCAEWMERFGPNDVFATPVVGYLELLESEQAIVNGYIREFDHPTAGRIRLSGNAIRMSETPLRDPAPGPALSADTDQLLRGLGYSSEDIGAFRAAQVI